MVLNYVWYDFDFIKYVHLFWEDYKDIQENICQFVRLWLILVFSLYLFCIIQIFSKSHCIYNWGKYHFVKE